VTPGNAVRRPPRAFTYRVGVDELLVGADDASAISMEDYAVALVDEIETPRHVGRRFTVGY
jgi:putative NADH-flavin reductase